MIYLDYSATTPVLKDVQEAMNRTTNEFIGNANSINALGIKSGDLLNSAIKQIAELFSISEKEITFTASSTESNNMALIGTAFANVKRGKHIIVSKLEHPSIYAICKYLESMGFEISYLKNDSDGLIDFEDLKSLIRKDTILVSVCAVNSELGIRQPLKMIKQIIKKENPSTIFHSDMTQAVGKISVSLKDVDLASISSHKIYGPKGIALFYKNASVNVSPLIYGSGKSNDLKPGTPALPLIVGFSKALRIAVTNVEKNEKYVSQLNDRLVNFFSNYKDVLINKTKYSIPQILNISLMNIRPETFIHALDSEEIYVSTNTACSSGEVSEGVMRVFNDRQRALHTIRISLSGLTTSDEINRFVGVFDKKYKELNNIGGNQ